LLPNDKVSAIIKRTQDAGAEVVNLLKTGSAFVSPAMAAMEMVEAHLHDRKRVLPCAAYCEGEYGINGYYVGVPAVIGGKGVEKIIEIKLNDAEKAAMQESFKHVKSLVDAVKLS
jgi:malate dehydrogenase